MKNVNSIKYNENKSSVSGVVLRGRIERQTDIDRQTDRYEETNSPICKFTKASEETREYGAFDSYVKTQQIRMLNL